MNSRKFYDLFIIVVGGDGSRYSTNGSPARHTDSGNQQPGLTLFKGSPELRGEIRSALRHTTHSRPAKSLLPRYLITAGSPARL